MDHQNRGPWEERPHDQSGSQPSGASPSHPYPTHYSNGQPIYYSMDGRFVYDPMTGRYVPTQLYFQYLQNQQYGQQYGSQYPQQYDQQYGQQPGQHSVQGDDQPSEQLTGPDDADHAGDAENDEQPQQLGDFGQQGYPGYQNYPGYPAYPGYPGQATAQPRKKKSVLVPVLLTIAAVCAVLFGITFFNNSGSMSLEPFFDSEEPISLWEIADDYSEDAEGLAAELDHIHDGIQVDWATGQAYNGIDLDPGQRVESAPGVFMIETTMLGSYGAGTGFVIGEKGLAVTNYHVVDSSSRIDVTMADSGKTYEATVLGRDSSRDVAVLQIHAGSDLPVASISTDSLGYDDLVASVGNGNGQGYLTSVVGNIKATRAEVTVVPETNSEQHHDLSGLIQTSSDVVPGYSGGPTVDADGQIIGMTTASTEGTTSRQVDGFAVPIMEVLDVATIVLSGEPTDTVTIGMGGALGVIVTTDENGNVIVQSVVDGSEAERIGLRVGDQFLSMNGRDISSGAELSAELRSMSAGDEVQITWRDTEGQPHEATATLQEAVVN